MNNEMINKPPFKVKCIDNDWADLTVSKEYNVVEIDEDILSHSKNEDEVRVLMGERIGTLK